MSFSEVKVTIQLCLKCARIKDNTCPFKPQERAKIINCTAYINKKAERQNRRWSKFE